MNIRHRALPGLTVLLLWLLLFAGFSAAGQPVVTDSVAARSSPQCGHYAVLHCCQLLGVPIEMK